MPDKYISENSLGALSLLYGKFNNKMVTEQRMSLNNYTGDVATVGDVSHRLLMACQLGLGLQMKSYLSNEKSFFELRLGWEQNLWFGANQLHRFRLGTLTQEKKNLSLQGFVARGKFNF